MKNSTRVLGYFGEWRVYPSGNHRWGYYARTDRTTARISLVWLGDNPEFTQLPAETQEGLLNIVKLFGGEGEET